MEKQDFNEILLYTTADGSVKIEILFESETFWLSQKKMAELFDVESHTVTYHLKEIFKGGELDENSVTRKIRATAADGKILKSDVIVAKNYLNEQHISELNRIVSAYLDLAENRAERQIVMNMADWTKFLHQFLELSNYPILENKGTISALEAKIKADSEYEKYKVVQDQLFESDFDKQIKLLLNNPK